jgi:hypothetical protein
MLSDKIRGPSEELVKMEYPHMIRVRQTFDGTTLDDVAEEIDMQLANLKLKTLQGQYIVGFYNQLISK